MVDRDEGGRPSPVVLVAAGLLVGVLLSGAVVGVVAWAGSDEPPTAMAPVATSVTVPATDDPGGGGGDDREPAEGSGDVGDDPPPSSAAPPRDPGAPPDLPTGERVSCPASTVQVGSADELTGALAAAGPGTVIELRDGTYPGAFVLGRSGTPDSPIWLCGGVGAVLDGGGPKKGYGLHLDGASHVRVIGFTVRNAQKGVIGDGISESIIQGLTVEDIGDEAIHLRAHSTGNAVVGNTIRRTGLRRDKFGEGIYIGSATSNWGNYSGGEPDRSDNNLVQGNRISETSSEAIDIKEGTTGGRVIGNTLDGTGMTGADSLIDVKGNEWVIEDNVGTHAPKEGIQTHRILDGWGERNVIRRNTIDVDGEGNHVYVHDAETTFNHVACDNRTGAGGAIRANVTCEP